MNGGTKRGRPQKSLETAALEAAHVLNMALALRLGRRNEVMGFRGSESSALRYVQKRRRGLVAAFIGRDAHHEPPNHLRRALQLVIEHDVSVVMASRMLGADLRNLRRLLPQARAENLARQLRREEFAKRTVVVDAEPLPGEDFSP